MRRIKNLAFTGALAAALVLFASSRADAALNLYLQAAGENGGAVTLVASAADFTSLNYSNANYGGFNVSVFGGSSNNGLFGGTFSNLLSSTTSVINNGAAGTLSLYVSQNNYTLPVGTPLVIDSSLGGSISAGTLDLVDIFEAKADINNQLLGSSFSNGLQDATRTGNSYDTGSAVGLFTRSGNYSLTSTVFFEMGANSIANFSSQVNVRAVPEPGSMLLLGTGLFSLAGAARRRMRRANL